MEMRHHVDTGRFLKRIKIHVNTNTSAGLYTTPKAELDRQQHGQMIGVVAHLSSPQHSV